MVVKEPEPKKSRHAVAKSNGLAHYLSTIVRWIVKPAYYSCLQARIINYLLYHVYVVYTKYPLMLLYYF